MFVKPVDFKGATSATSAAEASTTTSPNTIWQTASPAVDVVKIKADITKDLQEGILIPQDNKFLGVTTGKKYVFNGEEYNKKHPDRPLTIGRLKERYNIPDGVLRNAGLDGYPGNVDTYFVEKFLNGISIPSEYIDKYKK